MKTKFSVDIQEKDGNKIVSMEIQGDRVLMAMEQDQGTVRGIQHNDKIYPLSRLKTNNSAHIIAWLMRCRDSNEVSSTINDFIIKKA